MKIETKINKCYLIKLKSFYTAKETINKAKTQSLEWDKTFVNKTMDKGLISKLYKQLKKLRIKNEHTTQLKNGSVQFSSIAQSYPTLCDHMICSTLLEDLNRHLSKEYIKLAKKHLKRCSILLVNREMKIKTIVRYHLTLAKMAIIKKSSNNKCQKEGR